MFHRKGNFFLLRVSSIGVNGYNSVRENLISNNMFPVIFASLTEKKKILDMIPLIVKSTI